MMRALQLTTRKCPSIGRYQLWTQNSWSYHSWQRQYASPDLLITNLTQHPLAGFKFQFNKNSFMLAPIQQPKCGNGVAWWEQKMLHSVVGIRSSDIAGKYLPCSKLQSNPPFRMMLFSISAIRYDLKPSHCPIVEWNLTSLYDAGILHHWRTNA